MANQTTHLHLRHRGLIPTTQLGTGLASPSNFLRGDQQWSDRYVHAITSSSSNSFIGQVDIRAGNGVALAAASNTITISATAGGGGGADHNLLSATHLDTLVGTIVRGDLIRGNSTPKWERLPISGSAPSNAVLVSDGTDAYWRWPAPVDRITASASNVFWGQVDFRAGANTALAVASNTITISSSGGGGGGGAASTAVSWSQLDEVPTGPGWTAISTSGTPTNATLGEWQEFSPPATDPLWNADTDIPSALVMYPLTGANNLTFYRTFAPSSGTRWSIVAKVRLVVLDENVANGPRAHLYVENTTPTATDDAPTDGIVVELSWDQTHWECRSFQEQNGTPSNIETVDGASTMYLGLAGSTDNAIRAYVSGDGLGWVLLRSYSGIDINGAVSHVAITAGQANTSEQVIAIWEFVRFAEGSGNLWDLGAGN